ncbi:MAG: hypothetical protein NVSMB9_26870 [Isosphaeraceae bacterium]
MSEPLLSNKYRAAIEILQKGRDVLVEAMAEEILDQGPDLVDGGFQFNEFLESQGTRLHFLSLLVGQLEQSAEAMDEAMTAPPPPPPPRALTKKRSRAKPKKMQQKVPTEGSPDDA